MDWKSQLASSIEAAAERSRYATVEESAEETARRQKRWLRIKSVEDMVRRDPVYAEKLARRHAAFRDSIAAAEKVAMATSSSAAASTTLITRAPTTCSTSCPSRAVATSVSALTATAASTSSTSTGGIIPERCCYDPELAASTPTSSRSDLHAPLASDKSKRVTSIQRAVATDSIVGATSICNDSEFALVAPTTCSFLCPGGNSSALAASMTASMVTGEADVTKACRASDSCVYPVAQPVAIPTPTHVAVVDSAPTRATSDVDIKLSSVVLNPAITEPATLAALGSDLIMAPPMFRSTVCPEPAPDAPAVVLMQDTLDIADSSGSGAGMSMLTPFHKPEDADTAVTDEDERLLAGSSVERPLALVTAMDVAGDHSFVTDASAMSLTLVALGVHDGRFTNEHKVALTIKLKDMALFKTKEMNMQALLPQLTLAKFSWYTFMHQLQAIFSSSSGTCDNYQKPCIPWIGMLSIGLAAEVSLIVRGSDSLVLPPLLVMKFIPWYDQYKWLHMLPSGHCLASSFSHCLTQTGIVFISLILMHCMERNPWPPPNKIKGTVLHKYFIFLAELKPWPSWELCILVVHCHYTRVCFQWEIVVQKYISSSIFLAGSTLFDVLATQSTRELGSYLLWSQTAMLLLLAYGTSPFQEPVEQWDPGIAMIFNICTPYCYGIQVESSVMNKNGLSLLEYLLQSSASLSCEVLSIGNRKLVAVSFDDVDLLSRVLDVQLLLNLAKHSTPGDTVSECFPYLVSVILLNEELQLSWYPGGCKRGSCHYTALVCLHVAEFSCLRRLFLWEIAWPCCVDGYRLFLWEIAWPMVLEYSHIDKKSRHLILDMQHNNDKESLQILILAFGKIPTFIGVDFAPDSLSVHWDLALWSQSGSTTEVYAMPNFDEHHKASYRTVWIPSGSGVTIAALQIWLSQFMELLKSKRYASIFCELYLSLFSVLLPGKKLQMSWYSGNGEIIGFSEEDCKHANYPGGSPRHRLEVKPKIKEGGMLATSTPATTGLGLGCLYWAWAARKTRRQRLQISTEALRTSWLGTGWLRPPCFCLLPLWFFFLGGRTPLQGL